MDASSYQPTAVVGSCTSRHEAELQRHVLEEAGIPSSLSSDDAGGLHPELAFTRCATYRILVAADQVERARDVLADFEPDAPGDEVASAQSAQRADTGLGQRVMFWVALLLVAVVVWAAVSNVLNVFTAT